MASGHTVPRGWVRRVPLNVQDDVVWHRCVLAATAEAYPVDVPGTGASFVALQLGLPADHFGSAIKLVHVDEMASADLDFVHVYDWSEPEDEVVVCG